MRRLSRKRYREIQETAEALQLAWDSYVRIDEQFAALVYADTIAKLNCIHSVSDGEWTLDQLLEELQLLKPATVAAHTQEPVTDG